MLDIEAMSKDLIRRDQVHDTHMKYVIIRLDYSGVQDSGELISAFERRFLSDYRVKKEGEMRKVSVTYSEEDLRNISKAVKASVREIENEKIARYVELKNVKGAVTLDISKFYICMTIGYDENYEGLRQYLDSFKGAITTFKDKFGYFSPKRLGIRKCRVQEFTSAEEMNSVFEQFVYNDGNLPIGKLGDSPRMYRASLQDDGELAIKVNIIRKMRPIYTPLGKNLFTSLDIDAYVDNQALLAKRNINKIIDDVNEFEFKVYKMCMREDALLAE